MTSCGLTPTLLVKVKKNPISEITCYATVEQIGYTHCSLFFIR